MTHFEQVPPRTDRPGPEQLVSLRTAWLEARQGLDGGRVHPAWELLRHDDIPELPCVDHIVRMAESGDFPCVRVLKALRSVGATTALRAAAVRLSQTFITLWVKRLPDAADTAAVWEALRARAAGSLLMFFMDDHIDARDATRFLASRPDGVRSRAVLVVQGSLNNTDLASPLPRTLQAHDILVSPFLADAEAGQLASYLRSAFPDSKAALDAAEKRATHKGTAKICIERHIHVFVLAALQRVGAPPREHMQSILRVLPATQKQPLFGLAFARAFGARPVSIRLEGLRDGKNPLPESTKSLVVFADESQDSVLFCHEIWARLFLSVMEGREDLQDGLPRLWLEDLPRLWLKAHDALTMATMLKQHVAIRRAVLFSCWKSWSFSPLVSSLVKLPADKALGALDRVLSACTDDQEKPFTQILLARVRLMFAKSVMWTARHPRQTLSDEAYNERVANARTVAQEHLLVAVELSDAARRGLGNTKHDRMARNLHAKAQAEQFLTGGIEHGDPFKKALDELERLFQEDATADVCRQALRYLGRSKSGGVLPDGLGGRNEVRVARARERRVGEEPCIEREEFVNFALRLWQSLSSDEFLQFLGRT